MRLLGVFGHGSVGPESIWEPGRVMEINGETTGKTMGKPMGIEKSWRSFGFGFLLAFFGSISSMI